MSNNAFATIPNYCSYSTFKTGFQEGFGACCLCPLYIDGKTRAYHTEKCVKKTKSKYRVEAVKSNFCQRISVNLKGDGNNNSKFSRKELIDICDWFDAYSVQLGWQGSENNRDGIKTGGYSLDVIEDNPNNELEGLLSRQLSSPASKQSSAKSWKRNIDKASATYSSDRGCMDWLETCSIDGNTDLDDTLLESFKADRNLYQRQSLYGQFGNPVWRNFGYSDLGMFPACGHFGRKFGTYHETLSSNEENGIISSGEATFEEEVFEEELYYLGPPTKVSIGFFFSVK